MMKNALNDEFDVSILIDEREGILRNFYSFLGPKILKFNWSWKNMGKYIANRIIKEKPDIVILIIDITASAIPYLKEKGIKVVLSIEDLSWEWLKIKEKHDIINIFKKHAVLSDKIITISKSLQIKLKKLSLNSMVVPIGIEKMCISHEDRLKFFKSKNILLHAGKIQHEEEFLIFNQIANKLKYRYSIKSYMSGKYSKNLVKKFPWIDWYNYTSPEEAINQLKSCSLGIIIRYRAHKPTRLYYHASMLQPIIAMGDKWTSEVKRNKIGIVTEPENIEQNIRILLCNYHEYLYNIKEYAEKNMFENAYSPFIHFLRK